MSSNNNKLNVPQAKQAMEQFKMQAASEVGVNLQNGYNGNLTSREAGSVGGQMVKKMIEAYESGMQEPKIGQPHRLPAFCCFPKNQARPFSLARFRRAARMRSNRC